MGTTLTGTTPQDTYDSLIKVTDNGPLSGSLKVLTDGLGNNSSLALSTGAASVTGTLAVSGNATFDTNTLFVDAAANEVGVGTTSPSQKLHVSSAETTAYVASSASLIEPAGGSSLLIQNTGTGGFSALKFISLDGSNSFGYLGLINTTGIGGAFVIGQRTGAGSYAEQMRITDTGSVGIGTSAPTAKLQVTGTGQFLSSSATIDGSNGITINKGSNNNHNGIFFEAASVSDVYFGRVAGASDDLVFKRATGNVEIARMQMNNGGISFNGDTAAANALDDYEEGTWTMGVAFGGAAVGVIYNANTGTYTKIGRQVTVNGYLILTSKGSSSGNATITGLPFTVANGNQFYAAASLRFKNITFANQFQGFAAINSTTVAFEEVTEAGVVSSITNADFANDSEIMVSFTYIV